MYNLAKKIIDSITKNKLKLNYSIKNYKKIKWSKILHKKKDLEKLYIIKPNLSKKEFDKVIRATITKKFKPYFIYHKKKFELKD